MRVFINEYDRDYHTVTDTFEKEFESIEKAEMWCRDNKWSGYTYWIDRSLTEAVNKKELENEQEATKKD